MKFFKSIILWIIILSSIKFFEFKFLGEAFVDNIVLLGPAVLVMIIFLNITLTPTRKIKKNFSGIFNILFLAIFVSSVAAALIHRQPVLYSLIASRVLFFYLFYYVLHILKPTKEQLISIVFMAAIMYCAVYMIQFILYPRVILLAEMMPDRAKVRIRLPGYYFLLFGIIFSTHSILNVKKSLKFILISIFGSIFLLFLTTRIVIASTYLIQLLIFVRNKAKGLLLLAFIGLLFIAIAPFVINSLDSKLLSNLIEVSENDKGKADNYIRIRAFNYFSANLNKHKVTYITGNGNATGGKNFSSAYSKETDYEQSLGYFLDDLGIFGAYYRYGVLYLLFVFFLLNKVRKYFKRKNYMNIAYVKYWFLQLLILSITIDAFAIKPDAIIIICMVLYILDMNIAETKRLKLKPVYEEAIV